MDLRSYQTAAAGTDCLPAGSETDLLIPLLGLAGEVGELQSECKKALRDGDALELFRDRFAEELGDVLWYVANFATKLRFDLDKIAGQNLAKARERWGRRVGLITPTPSFDEAYPESQRLPRALRVDIRPVDGPNGAVAQAYIGGQILGDQLNDNSYIRDGYRYHDTFHFAFAAVLGWSPITRWLLGRKRRLRPDVDEVEDGARAKAAEEAISLFIFSHAKEYNWFEGKASVSSEMLRTVKRMSGGLEVSRCTTGEWEDAIVQGFAAWRVIERHHGGALLLDLDGRNIRATPPEQEDASRSI